MTEEMWDNIKREQELRDTRYADLVTDAILDLHARLAELEKRLRKLEADA